MTDDMSRADALVNDLAKVLERRRQEVGISQEELAKRAGISRTYLSDIERGLRNISVTTLTKLAHAMNTTASTLLAKAELATEAPSETLRP
jgi:transcriptional regulator with XRE-family HTH domain